MAAEIIVEKLASSIESRIAGYRARNTPRSHRPRVLVLIWSDPLTAVGRNSFLNELVTLAGAVNVAEDVDRDYFTVSSEWVVTQNPDAIFCFFMSNGMTERSTLESRPGWNGVSAVKTGRIYDHMDNNLILRPGPRMIQGIEVIAARLQQAHEKP